MDREVVAEEEEGEEEEEEGGRGRGLTPLQRGLMSGVGKPSDPTSRERAEEEEAEGVEGEEEGGDGKI